MIVKRDKEPNNLVGILKEYTSQFVTLMDVNYPKSDKKSDIIIPRDYGVVRQTIEDGLQGAPEVLRQIEQSGIDLDRVYNELQDEGVKAFETSYLELLKSIEEKGGSLSRQAAG